MGLPLYQVDAFTDRPFAGNPAAVCLLPSPRPEAWMQDLAAEMNLSETAFLRRLDDGWELRWFTPTVEVDLCGHATLASAHVLWETATAPPGEPLRFHTRSGVLTARQSDGWIALDFPAQPAAETAPPPGLLQALGAAARWTGRNAVNHLVEVGSEGELRALRPDFRRLAETTPGAQGVIVTASADSPDLDFVSRYFAPSAGIDEDPATGSSHCTLGPFWSERLGKTELAAAQASARGGLLRVRVEGERVQVLGCAVTVLVAELAAP